MKITRCEKVEDCFNGSSIYRYWFDEAWNSFHLERLRALGKLDHYPDFPKPFFRLRVDNGMEVKGIEGEANCLLILLAKNHDELRKRFELQFQKGKGADEA